MTENVRKFEKALRESWELQRRLVEELKKIAGERSASNDAEAMAKAAQALGYDFTVADMEKAHAETQELDPGEMEQAADGWCFADYDCYTAWNHDSPISRAPPVSAIMTASPCSMIPRWMSSSKKRKSFSTAKI